MDQATITDASLWQKAAIGKSNDACRQLMERHQATVWGVCSQLLLCRDDVEEAFQVTFIALLENGDRIQSADFSPWLYRVAYRAALRVRAEAVRKTPQANSEQIQSEQQFAFCRIEDAERSQLIAHAIDELPTKHREVLVLHYVRGLSREEVADILGTTLQAVKGRLGRARTMLRSRLVRRGISLGIVAAFLMRRSEASDTSSAVDSSMVAVQEWLTGRPFNLGKIQYSDLTGKNVRMIYKRAIWSKYSIATTSVAVVLASFFVGRISTGSQGAGIDSAVPVTLMAAMPAGDEFRDGENEGAPVHFVSMAQDQGKVVAPEPAVATTPPSQPAFPQPLFNQAPIPEQFNEPVPTRMPVLGNAFPPSAPAFAAPPAPQTIAAGFQPQPIFSPQAATSRTPAIRANRAPVAQPPRVVQTSYAGVQNVSHRGLPAGTWVRESAYGKITSVVDGNQIELSLELTELNGLVVAVRAEYAVASDGTLYGLIHAVDTQVTLAMLEDSSVETLMLLSSFTDVPFSLRCHTSADSVSIKSLNLGAPSNPAAAAEVGPELNSMLNLVFMGTFHSEK